ncbi:Cytochrome b561 and DOMON domain-containing protein, partial [Cucurbita argyrosperma subsp. argyrosperma]
MQYSCYSIPFLFVIGIVLSPTTALAHQHYHRCTAKFYELTKSKNMSRCLRLPTLGAEMGWSAPLLKNCHHVFEVVLGAPVGEEKGWLAWGVNPTPEGRMVGTRAAIGIKDPSGPPHCKTYSVGYETRRECGPLRPRDVEEMKCLRFEYDNRTEYYYLTATLNLSSTDYNVSKLHIVWQSGFDADGDVPKKHVSDLKNIDSFETVDLVSGQCSDMAFIKIYLRQVHGIMNIIGWGTMLPVGVIIARFFREFPVQTNDGWYYFHVSCQSIGFSIGAIGWGIGIWLAHSSPHHIFFTHHVLGIIIFVFATLQTLAIRFKPGKTDDSRKVWNIYHHFLGYALLPLIFINIFEGIRILKPDNKKTWKLAVIGILTALGVITFILEAYTWKLFIDNKHKDDEEKSKRNHCQSTNDDHGGGSINKHQHGSEINQDGSEEEYSVVFQLPLANTPST